jgi:hypothetical protein
MMPRGRVLLGATGEDQDWSALRDHLVSTGWQVDLFDPTPHHDAAEAEAALPLLEGVDLAVLMTPPTASSGDQISNRLVYLTGVLQGTLGTRRVLTLVAEGAPELVTGTNIPEWRYEPGNIRSHFSRVDELLDGLRARSSSSSLATLLERVGVVDGRVAPEVFLVLGALAVIIAFAGILGYQLLGTSTNRLSAEVEATMPSSDQSAPLPGSTVTDPTVAGPQTSNGLAPGGDGMVAQLPARCVVDFSTAQALPAEIECEGVGGLRVTGFSGPWQGQVHLIKADVGVVGDAVTGSPQSGDTGRIHLEPGTEQQLDPAGSTVGVQRLELQFSATGQEVTLEQSAANGGEAVTLTFGLELG